MCFVIIKTEIQVPVSYDFLGGVYELLIGLPVVSMML